MTVWMQTTTNGLQWVLSHVTPRYWCSRQTKFSHLNNRHTTSSNNITVRTMRLQQLPLRYPPRSHRCWGRREAELQLVTCSGTTWTWTSRLQQWTISSKVSDYRSVRLKTVVSDSLSRCFISVGVTRAGTSSVSF